jgi:hypothetical protein
MKPFPKLLQGYGGKGIPLGTYAGFTAVFNLLLANLLWRTARERYPHEPPETMELRTFLPFALTTHKLSRIITKDAVTSPFRAPFTRYQEELGYGEVKERARGTGLRMGVGELLTCNYCADPWVGLGLLYGLKYLPRPTRAFLDLFSAVTIADFLHVFYEAKRTDENVLTLKEEAMEKQASGA